MKSACLFLSCIFISLRSVSDAGEMTDKDWIKEIGQRYAQIEEQLDRAVHYVRKEEKAGETVTDQVWLTEARDYLKASTDRTSSAGRELNEIFTINGEAALFVLTRRETPLAGGATQVDETRRFFKQYTLIRMLTKKTTFQPGETLDTKKVKNVAVDISKLPEKEREGYPYAEQAGAIVKSAVSAGPADRDPSAGSPGDSARFRLIQQTTSPDGRFALGFGWADDPVPWEELTNMVIEETGYQTYFSDGEDKVRNYVIDLTTHRILGDSGCRFIGTRHRYNHRECFVSWSPQNRFFVQSFDSKWQTDEASAGWIDAEKGKAAATSILELAEKHAYQLLAARKDRAFRKHGESFAITVGWNDILDDGSITLDVTGQIPKSEEDDSTFRVLERFRIRRDGDRATFQFLDARLGPPL
jgi:hypothetical protein